MASHTQLKEGIRVSWVEDNRPMPGLYPGDDGPDSPCFDMSLVEPRTGTIVGVSHGFLSGWSLLIEVDGPEGLLAEKNAKEVRVIKEKKEEAC